MSGWNHYQERILSDPFYNNLKLHQHHQQNLCDPIQHHHLHQPQQTNQTYPDSTSHHLQPHLISGTNLLQNGGEPPPNIHTPPHIPTPVSHTVPVIPPQIPPSSIYHHSYNGYIGNTHLHHENSTVSSTAPDLGTHHIKIDTNVGVYQQNTTIHQRRGSLQLWQFLVALLDEPTSR